MEICTSCTRLSNALIASMIPAEKEKPAGLMMASASCRAGRGNRPLPSACTGVSAAGNAKSSHPKGINDLLTITIY